MDPINPPGVYRTHTESGSLESAIKNRFATISVQRRRTLEMAHDLGLLLKQMREVTPAGEWYPFLDRIGMNKRCAAEYLRVASLDGEDVMSCDSIHAALVLWRERELAKRKREQPEAGEEILCDMCRENGKVEDCEDCEEAKKAAKSSKSRKTGEVDFDWREYHKAYGQMVQLSDRLGKALGVLNTPVTESWQRRLEELRQEMRALWTKKKREEPPII